MSRHYTVTVQIEEVTDAEREWNASLRQYVEKSPRKARDVVRVVVASGDGADASVDWAIQRAIALLSAGTTTPDTTPLH